VVHIAPICHELDETIVDRFPRSFIGVTPQGWLRDWDEPDGKVRLVPWADPDRVLARADAIVVSEDDLVDPTVVATWAAKAKLLVVTRGTRGVDVYKQGEPGPYHSAAFKSGKEADPTGAGDVFAAAFFWHLHSTQDWRQAADWANCVASFVVEKRAVQGVPKLVDVEKRWKTGNRLKG
jgi:sugar/nucleoside kinase (ribokinase family)